MKKNPLFLLTPLLLASCGGTPSTGENSSLAPSAASTSSQSSEKVSSEAVASEDAPSSPSSEQASYVDSAIKAHYVNSNLDSDVRVRRYGASPIPYISLKEYVSLLYKGRTFPEGRDRFEVKKEGSVYTVTVSGGYTATFDIEKDTLHSENLWNFKSTSLNGSDEIYSAVYDGMPFTRVVSKRNLSEAKATDIDLSSYGIDLQGEDKELFVPIPFATDLFSNENILQGAYNGKDIYVFNFTENESLTAFGKEYYDPIFANPIDPEYAKFFYGEFCLNFDYFLGRPGRSSLERYYDLSLGLDKALEGRELGKIIKGYLKSENLSEYLAGTQLFGQLHGDGGHSVYNPILTAFQWNPSWFNNDLYTNALTLLEAVREKGYEELQNRTSSFQNHGKVHEARKAKLGKANKPLAGEETFTKDGDIAYIHIDGFMGEIRLQNEWRDYYSKKTDTTPFSEGEGGAVGAIVNGLTKAKADSEIKHIVIDLAANTGGSVDEMLFLINVLTGKDNLFSYNQMTKVKYETIYEFDLNFDRVFDEKDKELDLLEGRDVSVLTTQNGFSCGGICPVYLHDDGLFTIGEDCGGGCCSIYIQADAYGMDGRHSSPCAIYSPNGISVDEARTSVCDSKMDFPVNEKGQYDYSALYDTATLRNLIEGHYKK